MLQTLRRRLQGEREGGFTLIELMVVVLIIAILIAIAIPTFLGARTRAQNRAAQASLRNALVAAKSIYTDTQSYAHCRGCRADRGRAGPDLQGQGHRLDRSERRLGRRDDQRRPVGRGGALGLRDLLLDQGQRQHRDHVRLRCDLYRHGRAGCGRDQLVAPTRG